MGIDYDGVGGIGVLVTDEMIEIFIKQGLFTEDEFDDDPDTCIDKIGIGYSCAGNGYSGVTYFYLFVDGNTLPEINNNAPLFIQTINKYGFNYTIDDLLVIEDIYES